MDNLKRWYDRDTTLSYMVGLMQKSSEALQIECAKIIIEKAKSYGVKIANDELEEALSSFFRRGSDNKIVQESFEYLKRTTFDVQRGIAHTIIEKIEKL